MRWPYNARVDMVHAAGGAPVGEAISAHQDAAAIFRETNDRPGESMALNNLKLGVVPAGAQDIGHLRDCSEFSQELTDSPSCAAPHEVS